MLTIPELQPVHPTRRREVSWACQQRLNWHLGLWLSRLVTVFIGFCALSWGEDVFSKADHVKGLHLRTAILMILAIIPSAYWSDRIRQRLLRSYIREYIQAHPECTQAPK